MWYVIYIFTIFYIYIYIDDIHREFFFFSNLISSKLLTINIYKQGDCIDEIATPYNYGIVREFTGHGIGPQIHMLPHVFHFKNDHDFILEPGTCLTIEPMLTECNNAGVEYWDDGWTIVTKSKKRSAQFEHIVLITESGVEILT